MSLVRFTPMATKLGCQPALLTAASPTTRFSAPLPACARGLSLIRLRWNEWLTFPIKYRDLAPTSRFVFTVWHIAPSGSPFPEPSASDAADAAGAAAHSNGVSSSAGDAKAEAKDDSASPAEMNGNGSVGVASNSVAPKKTGLWTYANGYIRARTAADPHGELPVAVPIGGTSFPMFNKRGWAPL